jgi:23S rRNA (uracil1939-C5)-methyltransferase
VTTPETYTIKLTAAAYGGASLGRLPDGRAVFVPFALPGETVVVRLLEEKRGHAQAGLIEVLEPSAQRIEPACVHFGKCGGCQYQHIPYPEQLEMKSAILRDQLVRIGRLENPVVRRIVPSPNPYRYRNYVQFHLTPEGKLGYVEADAEGGERQREEKRPVKAFPIQECWLPETPIESLRLQLEFEALPEIERVGIRMGAGEEFQVILEGTDLTPPELWVEEAPVSVVYQTPVGGIVLAGSEHLVMEVLGRSFQVSAGSFFQVNTPLAEVMVDHLLENLPLNAQATLLEVYCGVGLFSAFLAPKLERLVGIESSESACEDFVVNLDEFENVELYEAAAEDVIPGLDLQADIILVDPPRAGIDRRVMDGLLGLHPAIIAYVSCDPATLGRDARRLTEGGYRLRQVTPFDLFPQTFHIESISIWEG